MARADRLRRPHRGHPPRARLGLWSTSNQELTDADRAELREDVESAPAVLRPLLRGLVEDPEKVRARLFTTMPRVFFAMLPVFAVILALFYRGRRFPTHLVFAAHVHAFAFTTLMLAEAVKFTRVPAFLIILTWAAMSA